MINLFDAGAFVISLDFELYWGVRDKRSIEAYESNLYGVPDATKEILKLFRNNDIAATWATVGLLFSKDIQDAKKHMPSKLPSYKHQELSPYSYINATWDNKHDSVHFQRDLIKDIANTPRQYIGSHTFSHYYAVENGQTIDQFESDIEACINIAKTTSKLKSMVFPRNQCNESYLNTLVKHGFESYRGNESSWLYRASSTNEQGYIKRFLRLLDSYFNLSGHNITDYENIIKSKPYNIASSRMLRPYSKKLSFLDFFKLRRIKKSMTAAAKKRKVFHLWWHPHNFGANTLQNMAFLEKIIEHYTVLNKKYNMISLSMEEISQNCLVSQE